LLVAEPPPLLPLAPVTALPALALGELPALLVPALPGLATPSEHALAVKARPTLESARIESLNLVGYTTPSRQPTVDVQAARGVAARPARDHKIRVGGYFWSRPSVLTAS
jgi:hypothetical protein